jgi:RNA processing factor Prp31
MDENFARLRELNKEISTILAELSDLLGIEKTNEFYAKECLVMIDKKKALNIKEAIDIEGFKDRLKGSFDNVVSPLKDKALLLVEDRNQLRGGLGRLVDVECKNLLKIVEKDVLIEILTSVGGLRLLSQHSSNTIKTLGKKKSGDRGYLYGTRHVKSVSEDNKKKMVRILSGKISIASKMDAGRAEVNDGLCNEIKRKRECMENPGELLKVIPLPIPIREKKKRRGGRRSRNKRKNYGDNTRKSARSRIPFNKECTDDEIMIESDSGL